MTGFNPAARLRRLHPLALLRAHLPVLRLQRLRRQGAGHAAPVRRHPERPRRLARPHRRAHGRHNLPRRRHALADDGRAGRAPASQRSTISGASSPARKSPSKPTRTMPPASPISPPRASTASRSASSRSRMHTSNSSAARTAAARRAGCARDGDGKIPLRFDRPDLFAARTRPRSDGAQNLPAR